MRSHVQLLGVLFTLAFSCRLASADTYTVINTSDSGAGSLRQAILDANSHPNSGGADQIQFNIPGTDVHTIAVQSSLPNITEPLIIDGLTQPGAACSAWPPTLKIVLSGSAAGANGIGLAFKIGSDASRVRGLVINQFAAAGIQIESANNLIAGNFIGTDASGSLGLGNGVGVASLSGISNHIGGTTECARNLISGNLGNGILHGGGSVLIEGNFIGTDVTGTGDLGNGGDGVSLGASTKGTRNVIGGPTAGARNIISGNNRNGIYAVAQLGSVEGNFIGTDLTGTKPLGNTENGISVFVDTAATIDRNIIAANGGAGIKMDTAFGGGIRANFIGTDPSRLVELGNGSDGILLLKSSGIFVGGVLPVLGPSPYDGVAGANFIAFNARDGIRIEGDESSRDPLSYNSIFANSGLGINLGTDGVTPNDAADADTGPNQYQNFPVLTSAVSNGATINIQGTFQSLANLKFTVQFFSSTAADPTTYGEGETWLGDLEVTTDGSGNASIDADLPASNVKGTLITATAILTDSAANSQQIYGSSEFSQAIRVTGTAGRLLNIATRLRVQNGENVLIGGFIITGSDPKKVIIRAIGPSLAQFFSGALPNPALELFQGSTLLQSNNDWKETQRTEIEATGIPPSNDLESAIVRILPPGSYTAVVKGADGNTGIGLVEAYDLDLAANSQLANIATRGFVESGNDVMIGGFIVGGGGGGAVKVVVRAIGPTLGNFGIAGALQDPFLELRDVNGGLIAGNDNWRQTQQADLQQTGLAPSDDRESAILALLNGGNFTAIVRGSGNTTGVAVVEAYNLP